ncbi:MAG: copper amine oxidase N-terminal domain-containing protein, partial [Clostridiales bacterium]|nr:copper amine oxidase N-terminal domain-containing protein [Clostridiales bacterium]
NVTAGSVTQASSASGKAMVLAQSDAIHALGATGLVIASITEQPADAGILAQWRSIDPVNAQLADTIYTVELTNDDKKTENAYQLFHLIVDLSAVNLTASQKSMLTGVSFDAASGTYKNLGGELSADGKRFSFYSSYAGGHSLIVSDTLIKAEFRIGSKEFTLNGKVQPNDVAPIIREGRTLVPIRVLAESLGAEVVWEGRARSVTLHKDGKSVSIVIGQPLPDDMGTAIILDDRTYLPLRYIGQMLDCNIIWKAETQTVIAYS